MSFTNIKYLLGISCVQGTALGEKDENKHSLSSKKWQ